MEHLFTLSLIISKKPRGNMQAHFFHRARSGRSSSSPAGHPTNAFVIGFHNVEQNESGGMRKSTTSGSPNFS